MVTVSDALTLAEFLALPEEKPALEYVAGVVTRKVSAGIEHSMLQARLVELVNRFGEPRRLVMAVFELRATFGGASVVPDVAVLRWERIPHTPTGRLGGDLTEPPDIAVEIVSPGQSVNALIRRCLWYVANGVPLALLIDPEDESIVLFRPGAEPVGFPGSDSIDLGEVIPDFTLSLADLFATLRWEESTSS